MGPGKRDREPGRSTGSRSSLSAAFGRLATDNAITAKISVRSPDYPVTLVARRHAAISPAPTAASYEGAATHRRRRRADGEGAALALGGFPRQRQVRADAVRHQDRRRCRFPTARSERPLILEASGAARLRPRAALRRLARGAADRPRPDARRGARSSPCRSSRHVRGACRRAAAACRLPPIPGELASRGAGRGARRRRHRRRSASISRPPTSAGSSNNFAATLPGETRARPDGHARHRRRARHSAAMRASTSERPAALRRLVARRGRLGGQHRPLRHRRRPRSRPGQPAALQSRRDDRRGHGDGLGRAAALSAVRPALRRPSISPPTAPTSSRRARWRSCSPAGRDRGGQDRADDAVAPRRCAERRRRRGAVRRDRGRAGERRARSSDGFRSPISPAPASSASAASATRSEAPSGRIEASIKAERLPAARRISLRASRRRAGLRST